MAEVEVARLAAQLDAAERRAQAAAQHAADADADCHARIDAGILEHAQVWRELPRLLAWLRLAGALACFG